MNKFVIVTDSCSDLNAELRKKYDIEYLAMSLTKLRTQEEYEADLDWNFMPVTQFYQEMKDGEIFKTAQVAVVKYQDYFTKKVEEGYDVLSISCSGALSSSYNISCMIAKEVMEKHPGSKIITIDSKMACIGLGLLAITASKLRAEGKTIDETAKYIEDNRLRMNQFAVVDSLDYLKRAGRVSATTAFFGGLMKVKPILISDVNGQNVSVDKVKGRKLSIKALADKFVEAYESDPYQVIAISHADDKAAFEELKALIVEKMPDKNVEILEGYIGPIIGASTGPGTLAIYFWGKEVTFDSTKK